MAEITAGMVKELREATGLGMMECKKALTEAGGDMKKAEELLRIKSGAKASKVAGRVAAEGAVGVHISADGKTGALVEINCETDFVAKDANFAGFVKAVAAAAANSGTADVDALLKAVGGDGQTVETARQGLIMKLGENISVRRFVRVAAKGRHLARVEHRADRRLLQIGRVGMPGAADVLDHPRLLAQLENLREVGDALDKRVVGRLGEVAGVAQEVGAAQFLVADVDRAMGEKGVVDFGALPVAERQAQIDAADLGAERAAEGSHCDRLVGHRRRSALLARGDIVGRRAARVDCLLTAGRG